MYPTLTDMGITHPNEIRSYELLESGRDEDVLRIKYRRKPGSLSPETRVYRFRRIGVTMGDGSTGVEISPTLNAAVLELDELLAAKGEVSSLAAQINEALEAVDMEVARVRELAKRIQESSGS